MSDKISDDTLKFFVTDPMNNYLSRAEMMQAAKELLARRAAEVKPVELPNPYATLHSGMQIFTKGQLHEAIKAAGGTVKEGE